MIRKIISILMIVILMTGMCMPVMAEDETTPASEEQTVPGEGQETPDDPGQEEDPEPHVDPEPVPDVPVIDPIKMSVQDTPQVKAGSSVQFEVEFTAVEGFVIDSVEMVTSTDINMFPFSIDLSNYKIYYGTDKAVYPFDLRARAEAVQGYYKIPVTVNYIDNGQGRNVQFYIPVYVTADKKEEQQPKEPETRPLPKVMVTGVCTDPSEVAPGKDFTLCLTFRNTSSSDSVKNMEITVSPQGGAFSSTSGTTTDYISYLGAGSSKSISMQMTPKDGLAPGVYSIDVRMVYDTSVNNSSSSANEVITISVSQSPQAKVAAIEMNPYGGAYVGESISVKSAVYNVGKVPLYNVFASFSTAEGILSSKEVFLGNIEAGGTGDISTFLSALNIGKTSLKLNVRYEDAGGKTYTLETETSYAVTEKQKNSSDILPEPEDDNGNVLKWAGIGVTAVAAAAGGYILYRRRKESETEDIEE